MRDPYLAHAATESSKCSNETQFEAETGTLRTNKECYVYKTILFKLCYLYDMICNFKKSIDSRKSYRNFRIG